MYTQSITASDIVNQVVNDEAKRGLTCHDDDDDSSSELSGHEHLFDPLYNPTSLYEATVAASATSTAIASMDHLSPREKRLHFCIKVAYNGESYSGWQRQPTAPSVQQTLEEWILEYPPIRDTGEGINLRVCGRTDAGVHALGQVCRLRTRLELDALDFEQHLQQQQQQQSNNDVRVLSVRRVSLDFHPVESCQCRAYAYIIGNDDDTSLTQTQVALMDEMLQTLQGVSLNYFGMSYGRINGRRSHATCTLLHARARRTHNGVVVVELVGTRFLRRMVRLLVATALEMVQLDDDSPSSSLLLDLIQQQDRTLASTAAPPDGLIFVGASFANMCD